MIAWAMPLASTMATGARIARASTSATSGQAIATRRVQRFREASSSATRPASTSPSATMRELPSAAAKRVE